MGVEKELPKMTKTNTDLVALSKRVEALEAKVGDRVNQPILPFLVDYSNDLGNSLAGNDRIGPLLKRLDELETFLDPLFGEREAVSQGVKMSMVESQADNIRDNMEMLEKVEAMKGMLDGSSIDKIDELKPKLAELSKIQIEQREAGEAASEETLQLVQKHNSIIASLTEAFMQADQMITKAEMAQSKQRLLIKSLSLLNRFFNLSWFLKILQTF